MSTIVIADATGLLGLHHLASTAKVVALFDAVTQRLEDGALRFPREVVDELQVIARDEFIAGWASGLGSSRDKWTSQVVHMRQVMKLVSNLGFDEGFESLDKQDPSIAYVARMGFELASQGVEFSVLSTDFGSGPLSPTMQQICDAAGWNMISAKDCAIDLSLPH
jgi:hypothetical protein